MISKVDAGLIDHTFLKSAGEADAVRRICREAKKFGFASVCVNPCEVPLAAKLLKGSKVRVCTVIGFPLGANTTATKVFEAVDALKRGAEELDFVVNQRWLKFDPKACYRELRELVASSRQVAPKAVLKLILECCNLTEREIVRGSRFAKRAGFDFVKTSTGFGAGGATVAAVALMRKTVGRRMGVKAAGGIRTREAAEALIEAGATRLGCSAGAEIVMAKGKVKRK